jgi:hypothetical protein
LVLKIIYNFFIFNDFLGGPFTPSKIENKSMLIISSCFYGYLLNFLEIWLVLEGLSKISRNEETKVSDPFFFLVSSTTNKCWVLNWLVASIRLYFHTFSFLLLFIFLCPYSSLPVYVKSCWPSYMPCHSELSWN